MDAMGQFPRYAPISGVPPMGSIVSSCVMDMDATVSGSYPGSGQYWYNYEPTPADGELQAAYDYTLGATSSPSTDDPTFTGTAGNSAAYFAFDGGDYFRSNVTQTTFLKNIHKTTGGQQATIVMAMRLAASSYVYGGPSGTSDVGFALYYVNPGLIFYQFRGGGAFSPTNLGNMTAGTIYLVAITVDYGANAIKYAINSRTFTSVTAVSGASTTDATRGPSVGCTGLATSPLINNSRVYGYSMFNSIFTNTDLSNVVDAYNTRHGRTYA